MRRSVLALWLAMLLAACSLALPGLPGAPPGRIALVTPEGAIATMPAGGGQLVLISPAVTDHSTDRVRRVYAWPTWSPDGRRVAFLAIDDLGGSGAVFIAAADGSERVTVHELASGYPIYLSWSPDGSQVSMLTVGEETLLLLVGDADGRGQPRLLTRGQPLYSSWSPDGRALLVHTDGGIYSNTLGRIQLISTEPNAAPERVDVDPSAFRAPAWSPTGAYQVLAGDNGIGTEALFLRDRDGHLRRFEDVHGPPAVVWSAQGDYFAWSVATDLPYYYDGLHIASPDGRTRRRLVDEQLFAFYWSPDGRSLAYVTLEASQRSLELRVATRADGSSRLLATFQPTREFVQFVTFFDQYAQSATIWSPDSRTLLFAGWPHEAGTDGPPTLYAVAADGSAPPRALTNARIGFYAPAPATAPRAHGSP